ncbi:SUMO1 sentrin specific peptidase 8 [Homalodisca vitripennis]|nr:SUMO1 sentrin specific peptidase 8 [Homalodisca vitripennis]
MVLTRGMSNVAINVIEEMFTNSENLDSDTETLVTSICVNLKKLEANNPHINVSDFESDIFNLLKLLDKALTTTKTFEDVIENLKCDILTLETRLEREKQRRHSDLNASYSELDIVREEKDVIIKENNVVSSSLIKVRDDFLKMSDECLSLKNVVNEKDIIIAKLSTDLETSDKQKLELSNRVNELKSSIKAVEEKSWLNNRWVDDKILDSYFETFNSKDSKNTSKVIFIGPSVSQMVKHGSDTDVNVLLGNLELFKSDYAFLCISDSVAALKADTGSHWSLLFVDVCGQSVYHLDSIKGANMDAAKLVTSKLGFTKDSLCELSCAQQNNSYECGLSVLVNAKFIKEGFCNIHKNGLTFCDWYSLFKDGNQSTVSVDKCVLTVTDTTVGDPIDLAATVATVAIKMASNSDTNMVLL